MRESGGGDHTLRVMTYDGARLDHAGLIAHLVLSSLLSDEAVRRDHLEVTVVVEIDAITGGDRRGAERHASEAASAQVEVPTRSQVVPW